MNISTLKIEDLARRMGGGSVRGLAKTITSLRKGLMEEVSVPLQFALHFPGSSLGNSGLEKARSIVSRKLSSVELSEKILLNRSAVIKPYVGEREPGFLLIGFESELGKLARSRYLNELEEQYRFLFMPSWHPFYSPELLLIDARVKYPYFVLPSDLTDSLLVSAFSERSVFLPFHYASWVNADFYGNPSVTPDIDLVMIANFTRRKRHWRLFEIMGQLPRNIRCTIAGVPIGNRTKEILWSEAKLFGVQQQVTIIESASDESLLEILSRSRLFCAMSAKEGPYIAVAEALMAGVPVAMIRSAKVGSRQYINGETGYFFDDNRHAAQQISLAMVDSVRLEPHHWAKNHISAQANSRKLNNALQGWSIRNDLVWTKPCFAFFCKRFSFECYEQSDRQLRETEEHRIEQEFGVTFR